MSTVRLLSPTINLVNEVMKTLLGSVTHGDFGSDLSGSVVVFPGKRPAHVLRKRLAEKIGSSFIPPSIESIDLFIESLCKDHFGLRGAPLSEFDAVAILFELHTAMQKDDKIGAEHFLTLETFYPLGVKIFSELEELTIAAVTPQQLQRCLTGVTLASARSLSLLYEPFYRELEKRGFLSRARLYQLAAENIAKADFSRYKSLVFAGFYAFTQTEERIIRHLLLQDNVTMLFQHGIGIQATLDRLQLKPSVEGAEGNPQHYYYESPDAHGELFALNTVLAEKYPEPVKESDRAAVILPSAENLFPLYHQTLSIYDQNGYNLALGYPLTRTPVYGFLMSLLDVVVTSREGEVFVPKYIQFLLHPYTKNVLFKTRTDVTRLLIHGIEEDCLRHSSRVFRKPEEIENDPVLMKSISGRLTTDELSVTPEELSDHLHMIHQATLQPLTKVASVGEFAAACINVLRFANDRTTAHRHPYFRPFVEAFIDHLHALGQSMLSRHSFEKVEHYLLLLRHIAAKAEVPFTGTPLQGLQVLGFLETRGLQFSDVLIIDMNDDILPGKAQQDVLLPLTVREQLGLSTYRDQERIKAYLFEVLRRGAETIHCFSVNNSEKERSRFIEQRQWSEQQSRRTITQFNTKGQEYSVNLATGSPEPVLKTAEVSEVIRNLEYSSTALDTYISCGLRFYYRYVLRLNERDELSGDVEQSDVGKIVHAILQEYFAPAKDRHLTVNDLSIDRLHNVVQKNFQSAYGSTQFGEQFFAKRQVEKHLKDFIEGIQLHQVKTSMVMIESLEQRFAAEIDWMKFIGNADRIETRNGRSVIIDYKTGYQEKKYLINFDRLKYADRETWKSEIGTFQLVLYMMLYSAIRNIPPENITPVFIFLGKKELDDKIEVSLFDSEEQMREWFPVLRTIVSDVVKEIADMKIPFAPTQDIKRDCPGCPYQIICGTQWAEQFSLY